MQNLGCLFWGDQMFIPALNDDPAYRFYTDSPRILLFNDAVAQAGTDGKRLEIESEIDLNRDRVRGVAKDPGNVSGIARRKMWYGLLEGAMEHEMAAASAGADGASVISTSALADARGLVTVRGDNLAAHPAGDAETAARLATATKAGEIALVPKRVLDGGELAWWAVNPSTADLRAVLGPDLDGSVYRGGGNEYATLLINISLPGSYELSITITPRLLSISVQVCKVFL